MSEATSAWQAGLRPWLVRTLLRPTLLARDVDHGWIGDLLGRSAWAEQRLPLLASWTAQWSQDSDDDHPELPVVHARPLAPAGLTIEFEAGRIRANAGCNTMSGTATVSGDTIAVDDMASTEMGCEAAAQESDAIVAELLTGRPTFRLDGSTLTLSGKRTAATLQRADAAAHPAALTGTTWTLDTLISGATASSLPASERAAPTLRIDGTNLVLNACNAMTGTATVTEQHLSVGALAQTKMSCGADLDRLEATIAETLAQPLTVELADGRLTLTAPDGSGLGFAAADGPQSDPAAR